MSSTTPESQPVSGFKRIFARKYTFLALAFVIFGATVGVLATLDLLPNGSPEALTSVPSGTGPIATATTAQSGELPTKVNIPKINLTATVANPITTDAAVLDQNLLYGAVRYPTSGTLGVDGANVVLFGHSSYLPVVHNQAFKTFDGIQNLVAGDQIIVSSLGHTYVYAVETVASASANTDGVPLTVTGQKLTLVTCDSFATKSDRFVVIAHLVESYPSAN